MLLCTLFTLLFTPIAIKQEAKTHTHVLPRIEIVLSAGKFVELTDGTLWEIAPKDRETAGTWLVPHIVIITHTGLGAYPYIITIKDTGQSVEAAKVDKTVDELKVSPKLESDQSKKQKAPKYVTPKPKKKKKKKKKDDQDSNDSSSNNNSSL